MCSKVLNGHIILTDTSITTILAPEMTYTPENYDSSVTYVWSSTLPPYTGEGFTFTVDFASDTDEPVLHDIECRVLKNGLSTSSGVHLALIPQGYSY